MGGGGGRALGVPPARISGSGSGSVPDVGWGARVDDRLVPRFRIHHRHEPAECGVVVASWQGFASLLRDEAALSSCRFGGHEIWWDVDGPDETEVLGLLPPFIAERSTATRVGWLVATRTAPAHEPTKENHP